MPVQQRIALTLPNGNGVEASIEDAKWAESEGYDDVWFADINGGDALTMAAAVALSTSRVRIGTAIIPVFTRTPSVFASTAHVLHKVSDGRFILGLGSSSQTMMENWNGLTFEKPLTRVKETAQIVRSMLAGEKSDFDGQTLKTHGYRQAPLPAGEPPIYIAGLRGKMLEMAAEVGDGVILNLFPKKALPKMMEHIRIGAERAGKKLEDIEIVCRHQVVATDDAPRVRDLFRKHFAPYYATPVYNNFLAWSGYEENAKAIREGWAARDRNKTTAALEDDLVDEIGIIGSAEYCHDRIREYADMGITTHILAGPSQEHAKATQAEFTAERFSF
jgi:probable F420-dependent oxidoreductase